jgi:ABC-type transport system involved in multi-copper enzyme maturation permease subunit
MASERRYLAGFGGFLWGEALPWLGWRGLVRVLGWTGLVNGVLYLSVATTWDPSWITLGSLDEAVDWVWLFASIGTIAVTVGPVVGERRRGTTAWVVSKPVSRGSYIIGKVVAHGLGVAVSMVFVPGLVAYAWLPHVAPARGFAPPLPPLGRYLAALGVIALLCTFLVALVVMTGTLLKRRGPVTAIALFLLIFVYVPPSGFGWSKFLPGMLVNWLRPTGLSALADFVFGQRLPGEALGVTIAAIVAFTGIAMATFRRSEL